jgi:hypothetical protein
MATELIRLESGSVRKHVLAPGQGFQLLLTCNVRVLVVHVHLDGVGHKHEHLLPLVQQNHEPQVADALQQAAYRDIKRLLLLSKWKLFDAC